MNKIFKKIWNKRRGCFVAVSETSTSITKSTSVSIVGISALLFVGNTLATPGAIDISPNTVVTGESDRRGEDFDVNGNLTVDGIFHVHNLYNNGPNDSCNFDHTQITQRGVLNIYGKITQGYNSDGEGKITNNGVLNLINGATYDFNSDNSNSYLAGSGTINGGNIRFNNVKSANQGAVNNFHSLTLINSVLSLGSLNAGSGSITTNSGSRLAVEGSAYISTGDLSGTSIIENLSVNGVVQNRGNLTATSLLVFQNYNNSGTTSINGTLRVDGAYNNFGNTLISNKLVFGRNGKLSQSSGSLQTNNALNIFDSLGTTGDQELKYVGLNSSVPQEVKTSLNSFFQKYVPGSVAKTLAQHATFTGGKVIISGVNITETQRDDLAKAFKSQFFILSNRVSSSALV